MVAIEGLQTFIKYFKDLEDHYVLIGGAACSLWLEEQGLPFRSTKDLDVVVIVEGLSKEFFERFWSFIKDGDFKSAVRKDGKLQLYRFQDPGSPGFPTMIELLTKNILEISELHHLSPLPSNGEISSLSAILLDDAYYDLVLQNRVLVQEVIIIPAQVLMTLKVKAWLDLVKKRNTGDDFIRGDDIRKHRNDVFRLLVTLTPADRFSLPNQIRKDMSDFISRLEKDDETWLRIHESVKSTTGVTLPGREESFTLLRQIFFL